MTFLNHLTLSLKSCIRRVLGDLKHNKTLIAVILLYLVLFDRLFHCICPFALITGLPCPGCGMTRAFRLLITLHITEAFAIHPMIFLWVPYVLFLLFRRYIQGRNLKTTACHVLLILIGLLTIAIYVYRMCTMFPHTAPMTYKDANLFHLISQLFLRFF